MPELCPCSVQHFLMFSWCLLCPSLDLLPLVLAFSITSFGGALGKDLCGPNSVGREGAKCNSDRLLREEGCSLWLNLQPKILRTDCGELKGT